MAAIRMIVVYIIQTEIAEYSKNDVVITVHTELHYLRGSGI